MAKRKKASPSKRNRTAQAPDPAILKKAKEVISSYRIIIDADPSGGFIGTSVELPTVFGEGDSPEECYDLTRAALLGAAASMIELGQKLPIRGRRSVQVNVRLTSDEKLTLLEAARRFGLRSTSDFMRTAALQLAGSQP